MIESKIEITKLTATNGHTLTNGKAYGKEIYLGKNDCPNNWREITDAEYTEIVAKQEAEHEEITAEADLPDNAETCAEDYAMPEEAVSVEEQQKASVFRRVWNSLTGKAT